MVMQVLLVQSKDELAAVWQGHLERLGVTVSRAKTEMQACALLSTNSYDVVVLDVVLEEGSALSVADVAYFRQPTSSVVFVTDTTFFSDGSIFIHSANARAFVRSDTPPQDLAAIVQHYGDSANCDHVGTENQSQGLSELSGWD